MDTLRALRQPAAWIILGVAGAKGLISLVMMLTSLDRGVARAAQSWSGSVMGPFTAVLIVAVVLSLVLINPRPPQTKLLVTIGVGLVAGLGVIALIGAFIGLADIGGGGASLVVWFLRQLLDLAIVAVSAFVLFRVMMAVANPGHHGAGTGSATQIAEPGGYQTSGWGNQPQTQPSAPQAGWGATPHSLPPQGAGTPHSLPPQPQPHQQPQQPQQQQPQPQHFAPPQPAQPQQQPYAPQHAQPYSQQPQQGPGPANGGPPEDYTRIAPRRQA